MAKQTTALIDGDLLLYRFGHRGQEVIKWDEETTTTIVQEAGTVIEEMEAFAQEIMRATSCTRLLYCLSGPKPFRYEILPSYKHNRQGVEKPVLYTVLKDHLLELGAKVVDGLEADDILGIISTRGKFGQYTICSIDKDLEQIPGRHFNWNRDSMPRIVMAREADRKFYMQCLTGDPTDGFSGCPKIGPVKAKKIINSVEEGEDWEARVWEAIVETYANAGLDESYALTQARMARILRAEDYDFKAKKPKLWEPKRGN